MLVLPVSRLNIKHCLTQGKKLPAAKVDEQGDEVSDEDESAEAQDQVQQEKSKKKSKLKLNPQFSGTVGMKSVHFSTTQEIPKGR